MKPSDSLHQLLHSLSQAEKRYLSIRASTHKIGEQNKYALLMELIQGQDSYAEDQLKANFKQLGGDISQFATIKHYLFDFVLNEMRSFHRADNPLRTVHDMLLDVNFLHSKGLLRESEKRLEKAKKLAATYEFYEEEIQCINLMSQNLLRSTAADVGPRLESLGEEAHKIMQAKELTQRATLVYFKSFSLARKWFAIRNESGKELLESLQAEIAGVDMAEHLGFTAQLHLHRTRALIAQLDGDLMKSFELQTDLHGLWVQNPQMKLVFPGNYITSLANLLGICHTVQRYEAMTAYLNELGTIKAKLESHMIEVNHNLHYYTLLQAINGQMWEQAQEASTELVAFLAVREPFIPKARVTAIRYNVAVTFFLLQRPKPALQALNAILNDEKSQHREDIQQAARLMQAVVHYELGNTDLLEHLLRSAQHYMKKKGTLFAFEEALVRHLRQLIMHPDRERVILEQLQEQLHALKDDPANARAPGLQEIQYWVQSRLLGVPLHTLVGVDEK